MYFRSRFGRRPSEADAEAKTRFVSQAGVSGFPG